MYTIRLKANALFTNVLSKYIKPLKWEIKTEHLFINLKPISKNQFPYYSYFFISEPSTIFDRFTMDDGVAWSAKKGSFSEVLNPTLVAYSGLINYNHYVAFNDPISRMHFNKSIEAMNTFDLNSNFGIQIPFDIPDKSIQQPWYSALSQGLNASQLLRKYLLDKNEADLTLASNLIEALFFENSANMVIRKEGAFIWLEEYPMKVKSMVLNGYLSAIIAVLEYTQIRPTVLWKKRSQVLIESLNHYLPLFTYQNHIRYSQYKFHFANIEYQTLHIFQFLHLYMLTQIQGFKEISLYYSKKINWNLVVQIYPDSLITNADSFEKFIEKLEWNTQAE